MKKDEQIKIDASKININDVSFELPEGAIVYNMPDGIERRVIRDATTINKFNIGDIVQISVELPTTKGIQKLETDLNGQTGIIIGKRHIDETFIYNMLVLEMPDGTYMYEPSFVKKVN